MAFLHNAICKTAAFHIHGHFPVQILNSISPTEFNALGIASAVVALKSYALRGVKVHMPERASLRALAATDAKLGSNADIASLLVFGYSPHRADV